MLYQIHVTLSVTSQTEIPIKLLIIDFWIKKYKIQKEIEIIENADIKKFRQKMGAV